MSRLLVPIREDDHILGPTDAPITLVEYGDFECPHCGKAYREVKQLLATLGDQVCFVFRQFPLVQLHPNAALAAEASEAAAAQGRFWEMHAMLFEHQRALGLKDLLGYAEKLGLDVDRFSDDLEEGRFGDRIRDDFLSGARSGVSRTPTFFLNGELYTDAYRSDSLYAAIESSRSLPTY